MADTALAGPDKSPPPALLQLVNGGGTGLEKPTVDLPAPKGMGLSVASPAPAADISPQTATNVDWADEAGQFKARVSQMLAAMPPELRMQAQVISGFRTAAQQQDAWQRYQSGAGGLAARPGMSRHEKGLAADWSFKSPAAQQWMHDNAAKFGLTFPFGSEDPNHMQMVGPPTGGVTQGAGAGAGPIIAAAKERQQNAFASADKEQQLLQAAIAKIGTGGRTADQQKELMEARAKADAAVDRATKLLEHPPELEDRGIVERMGGLATVIGLLGGLVTRQPFMGSMSAAASAMEAYNAGDMRKYQVARENWKTQSDLLFKIAEINNKRASDILQDQHMNEQEKTAELTALFSAAGAEGAIGLLRDKGLGAVQDVLQKQDDVANEWKRLEKTEAIAHANRMETADMAHPEVQIYRDMISQFHAQTGRMPSPEEKSELLSKAKQAGKGQSSDTFTDADVDYWASVLKNGGHFPPGLARTSAGSQFVQKVMAKMGHGDGNAGDFIANVATVKADEGSLRNMVKMADAATSFERTASRNFDTALKLAPDAIPTELGPYFNRYIMEGEKMFGDPGVPAYVTAMLTGATEYAKIMSGSTGAQGSTVDSRREAAELFSPYLSLPQINAVVSVAKQDMANRKASLYGQVDDIKARLRTAGSGAPTADQGQGTQPSAGIVIQNGWRYDAKTHEPIGPVQ